jgi:hypothetical protein
VRQFPTNTGSVVIFCGIHGCWDLSVDIMASHVPEANWAKVNFFTECYAPFTAAQCRFPMNNIVHWLPNAGPDPANGEYAPINGQVMLRGSGPLPCVDTPTYQQQQCDGSEDCDFWT